MARSSTGAAEVVGINTAVAGIGLGLAVPINETTRVIVGADVGRPRAARLPRHRGRAAAGAASGPGRDSARRAAVEVVEVVAGSPAARAGLRPEDLILSVNGTRTDASTISSG